MVPIPIPTFKEMVEVIYYITNIITNFITVVSDCHRIKSDLESIMFTISRTTSLTTAFILSPSQEKIWGNSLGSFLEIAERVEKKLQDPKISFSRRLFFAASVTNWAEKEVENLKVRAIELERLNALIQDSAICRKDLEDLRNPVERSNSFVREVRFEEDKQVEVAIENHVSHSSNKNMAQNANTD